jgi:hypothetical protein
MPANSIEERLAVIEAGQQHIMAAVEDIKMKMDSTRYITPEMCAAQHKLYDAQIEGMRREVDGVYKGINGVSTRLEDMRKAWTNRLWAVVLPALGGLVASLIALVYNFKP